MFPFCCCGTEARNFGDQNIRDIVSRVWNECLIACRWLGARLGERLDSVGFPSNEEWNTILVKVRIG